MGPHHCKPHIHAVSRLLVLIKLFGLIKLLNLIEVSICIWSDYIILNRNNWATYSPRNNHNRKCKVFCLGFFWPYLHKFQGKQIWQKRGSCQRYSVRKGALRTFTKFTGKHLYQGLLFNKVAGPRLEKETLEQVFSCEFCEISKSTFFTEHLLTTAPYKNNNKLQDLFKKSCDWAQHGLLRGSSLVKAEEFKFSKRDYTQPQFWSNGVLCLGFIQPLLLIPAFWLEE